MPNQSLTEAQMDRVNLKTMANPLPPNYDSPDVWAVLLYTRDFYMGKLQQSGEALPPHNLSEEEATERAVDWYCTTPVDGEYGIAGRMDSYSEHSSEYRNYRELMKFMHKDPDHVEQVMRMITLAYQAGYDVDSLSAEELTEVFHKIMAGEGGNDATT